MIDVLARLTEGDEGMAALQRERERVGIGSVLVHADVAERFAQSGNRQLLEAAAAAGPDVAPIAVVAPESSVDVEAGIAGLAAAGAVGFRLGAATWSGAPTTASAATEALLGAVARSGRPLFVPLDGWGSATAIGERTADLGIAVILVGSRYDTIVDDLAAADRHPHLHLETSRLAHFGAVERVVVAIGHERLLLGTGSPVRAPSAPLNAVVSAAIDDAARRAILAGNAARLFDLPEPPIAPREPLRPSGGIDVHGHLPPTPWDVPDVTAGELLDALAAMGIDRLVASSTAAVLGDIAHGNAELVAACAADDRLRGYLVLDAGDIEGARDQLRRHGDAPGIVGVKVHCGWSGQATASAAMTELFALLADHGRPVKIHVDGEGWAEALLALARRHRQLPIIAAHAGPGAAHAGLVPLVRGTDNVHMELASSFAELDVVRDLVAAAPSGQLLFGSDAPLLDPAFALGTYADAGVTPDHRPDVFRASADALFA